MILVFDAGNTNTRFAIIEKGKIKKVKTTKSNKDDILNFLSQEEDFVKNKERIKIVVGSCVKDSIRDGIEECISFVFGCKKLEFIKVSSISDLVKINYKENLLGEDRFCNIIGAARYYDGAVLIIDFGTATTLDFITKEKEYIGGVILPGIDAFLSSFSILPRLYKPEYKRINSNDIFGQDTNSCLLSGAYFGYLGMIISVVEEMEKTTGVRFDVVLTGGASYLFNNDIVTRLASQNITVYKDKHLTIKGIIVYCEYFYKEFIL